jgi:hypothetical protein
VHSLHFIDFISWGVLDNGPLYCITLWEEKTGHLFWKKLLLYPTTTQIGH